MSFDCLDLDTLFNIYEPKNQFKKGKECNQQLQKKNENRQLKEGNL